MAMTGEATKARIEELYRQLDPRRAHAEALAELDDRFSKGRAPNPDLSGFLRGRLLTTSFGAPSDPAVRRVARLWMPWLGKRFAPESRTGVNVLIPSASRPLKFLWPSYEPVAETQDGLEVFQFHTRIEPGALDTAVEVLKIDYDSDANPGFIIRRILDELVEVDPGFYLGKILYRLRGSYRRVGFFTLEEQV